MGSNREEEKNKWYIRVPACIYFYGTPCTSTIWIKNVYFDLKPILFHPDNGRREEMQGSFLGPLTHWLDMIWIWQYTQGNKARNRRQSSTNHQRYNTKIILIALYNQWTNLVEPCVGYIILLIFAQQCTLQNCIFNVNFDGTQKKQTKFNAVPQQKSLKKILLAYTTVVFYYPTVP